MILDRARAKPGAFGALRLWICGFGVAIAAALAGCSANTKVYNGTPVVTVTSQGTGNFSTYVVGVSVYSMTRSDGYIAYPAGYTYEEFADLTQRVDLSELLNAVGIPTGSYTSVVIGIDYLSPVVYLKGATTAASVKDSGGTIDPGILYVTVKFDPSHPFVLSLNQSTPLALDFNLEASNTVNVSTNVVTVKPFVEAVSPSNDTKPVRARGLFVAANTGQSNFVEDLRPFEDNVYSTVGALQVDTTPSTYYNVDGKVYTGATGLAAVAAVAANTPIEAYGTLVSGGSSTKITPELTATQVYAGTVVSNGQYEHVRGIITGVSGTSLTVADATYLYYEGYCISNLCYQYFPTATIKVSPSTVVTEDNVASTAFSLFSVGSQIDAIGTGSQNSSTGALTLDATNGLVRLQSTPVWGTLASGASGSATLNVLSMGNTGLPASHFHFAGTGTSSATDASAASYAVGTSAASATAPSIGPDLTAVTAGTLLRIDGFPTTFGTAPPDFNATAVTPATSEPANLVVEWGGSGATAPFTSQDSTSLALNLSKADLAEVVMGPQSDCSGTATAACIPLTGTPAITISGGNQFAIGNATAGISMFSTSSAFASALGSTLNGSTAVYRVVAIGTYDSASNTFAATRVDVALE